MTKKFYYRITKAKDRVISKAELFGRLLYCGFEIVDYRTIDKKIFFIAVKKNEPRFNENPSYGPFFSMKRVGLNGNIINVYKLRTMHPYSEYLQDYIVQKYGYSKSTGKPEGDFRLTSYAKFIRKSKISYFGKL